MKKTLMERKENTAKQEVYMNKEVKNKNFERCVMQIAVILFLACTSMGSAMSGIMHLTGILDSLMGVPIAKGGTGTATMEQIQSVLEYIDYPSRQIGQYRVNVSGGKILSTFNHADLRHNPDAVAKVWHDTTGWVKNVVRMHKIQDISHNAVGKVSVDGWTITEKMQKQAQDILKHAAKGKGLPKHLPAWVDNQGPNIVGNAVTELPAKAGSSLLIKSAETLSKVVKGLSIAAAGACVAIDAGCTLYRVNIIQDQYYMEQISEEEYIREVCQEAGSFIGRTGGMVASAVLFVALTPAGPIGWFVSLAGTPIVFYGCELAGKYIGGLVAKGIIAWKRYQFALDYAAYKDAMTYVLDPMVPPELYKKFVKNKALQAAYKNCWDKRTKADPNWRDNTYKPDFTPVRPVSQADALRDVLID